MIKKFKQKKLGLDITHYKAILKLPEEISININNQIRSDYGIETSKSFSSFNVPFDYFKKYIQKIKINSTETLEGFYFQEVGYQRKGMNNKFWKRFCSSKTYDYALLEDFHFAYESLKRNEAESKSEFMKRKQYFKENFIDNFEIGKSFLSVSY